jgi:hypothetical protein
MEEEDVVDVSIILAILITLVACIVNSYIRDRKIYCYKQRTLEYIEV